MKEIINELIDKKQRLKEEIERKGVDMSTATFADYGDKIREIGSGSLYVTPLSQLGYSKEDEEFYSDLDFGTLGEMIEDFEYSRSQIGKWDGKSNMNAFRLDSKIKYAPYIDTSKAASFKDFAYCATNLVAVPKIDTSNGINMQSMFNGCSSLTSLDVSNWNTSNVTTMYGMFSNCSKLGSLDVSNWNTSNVTNMQQMFSGCSSLTSLDVSNWDTSNVTNMSSMFYGCSSLESLDVSGWDISKVDTIYEIFQGCKALEVVDVSTWYAPKVTQLNSCFTGLLACKEIDLSSWDLTTVQYMSTCFRGSTALEVIKLKNFGGHPDFAYDRTMENCPAWGSTPDGLQSLRDTLVNNSFDRASAGYSAVTISLPTQVKARLTTDEIAQITAKGFTIT
jgi:surface protein